MTGVNNFTLFAHRGDNRNFTENTLVAFYSSIKAGFTAMELDLVTLRDGNVVVFHDDDLKRICDVNRSVHEIDLVEFKKVFPALLTFDEFADVFENQVLEINLEIKDNTGTLNKISERVKKFKNPVISSFEIDVVHEACRMGLECAYLFSKRYKYLLHRHSLLSRRIHVSSRMILTPLMIDYFYKNYDVYCYTVNDVNEARILKSYPFIKGIFTDRVEMQSQLAEKLH